MTHDLSHLFDPTFSSCKTDAEFEAAWQVQAKLADAARTGKSPVPAPANRATIRRRQAAERDADQRLRDQYGRTGDELHFSDEEDDAVHAAVVAEVPEGTRVDGWTAWRRTLFLEKLEEHGSILAAARAVGMSRRSVYRLLPRAPAFAAAFDAAMRQVTATLADTLFDRALHGHEVPILHKGDVVATRTVHHDMLGLHLLRMRDPLNYAPPPEAERWLAARGLTPIPHRPEAPALSPPDTPATSDLRDLVQESPPASRTPQP